LARACRPGALALLSRSPVATGLPGAGLDVFKGCRALCEGVFGLLARFTWPLAIMEAAADQAIAACGGDAREADKVLIVATHF